MSCHSDEVQEIAAYYKKRSESDEDRIHDPLVACNALWRAELQFNISQLMCDWLGEGRMLRDCVISEVGCGSGGNLLEMVRLGANPELIFANDLMPDLIKQARRRLPQGISFYTGNVMDWNIPPNSIDLVLQFTVFSSIRGKDLRRALAERIWSWLKPNGAVLSYDFIFDNPRNPNVSKLSVAELREIFPQHKTFRAKRLTLAPPIARRVGPISPQLFRLLNSLPFLRTHALCLIGK